MSSRYIPRLESIANAAQQLPDASVWRDDSFRVPHGDTRLIEFRKIRFKDRSGNPVAKWIYDGKVRVN